jgi:hypothetical protein
MRLSHILYIKMIRNSRTHVFFIRNEEKSEEFSHKYTHRHSKKTDFFTHIHTQTIYKLNIHFINNNYWNEKKYDVKMMIYIFFEKDET